MPLDRGQHSNASTTASAIFLFVDLCPGIRQYHKEYQHKNALNGHSANGRVYTLWNDKSVFVYASRDNAPNT